MVSVLIVLNAVLATVSVAFGVVAIARPAVLSRTKKAAGSPTGGERFYAGMYASRAIPLGCAAGAVPFFATGPASALLLIAAAGAQIADVGIGLTRREWGMVAGGAVLAVGHLATAAVIW